MGRVYVRVFIEEYSYVYEYLYIYGVSKKSGAIYFVERITITFFIMLA
jgi:hypothetical protein